MFGKAKYVQELRSELGLTVAAAEVVFETFIDITKKAAEADTVRLPGIGVIRKNNIPAHEAFKPNTTEKVQVPERFNYRMSSSTQPVE